MQTETEIREGHSECKEEIQKTAKLLNAALVEDDNDKIAEHAAMLGMLGTCLLTVNEIIK